MANILPGISVVEHDGGLVVTPSVPLSSRILIIGSALDGPINRPVPVRSISEAEITFGPLVYKNGYLNPVTADDDGAAAGNTLLKGMHEVLLGGGADFLLCRVGGTFATTSGGVFADNLNISARYPGRIYNDISVTYASGSTATFEIDQPVTKGGAFSRSFSNTTPLRTVMNVLNNDPDNQTVNFNVPFASLDLAVNTLTPGTLVFTGGTNGTRAPGEDYATNVSGLYDAIIHTTSGTFKSLEDAEFDIGVFSAFYADDCVIDDIEDDNATTTTVAQNFAEFLHSVTKSYPCVGTIGLRPTLLAQPTDLTTYTTDNYLNTVEGFVDEDSRQIKFGTFMRTGFFVSDADTGEFVDAGRYLSIPAGPDIFLGHKDLGLYVENGYAVYAGVLSRLPQKDAATRTPLGKVSALSGIFSKRTHELLTQGVGRNLTSRVLGGGAYVTFRDYSDLNRPAVVNDVSCALRGSDFQYNQIIKIAHLSVHMVRNAVLPYIGKGLDISTRISLANAVRRSLDKMFEAGALLGGEGQGYEFSISSDPNQQVIGEVTVNLQIRPSIQLKFINIDVRVTR
jgi:hypothetical protein